MADVHSAILFTLHLEDSTLSGRITCDPHDSGGRTRYGIAERFHGALEHQGFYSTMSATAALTVALMVYQSEYAKPLLLDQINDQKIADSLLASAVNIGIEPAVKIMQLAAGVAADGCVGDHTIAAVNAIAPATLLQAMIVGQCRHYNDIVADNPSQHEFLIGWINRANAVRGLQEA